MVIPKFLLMKPECSRSYFSTSTQILSCQLLFCSKFRHGMSVVYISVLLMQGQAEKADLGCTAVGWYLSSWKGCVNFVHNIADYCRNSSKEFCSRLLLWQSSKRRSWNITKIKCSKMKYYWIHEIESAANNFLMYISTYYVLRRYRSMYL